MKKQVKKTHRMTQMSLKKKTERSMLKRTLYRKTLQSQNQIGNQETRRMFSKIIIKTVLRLIQVKTQTRVQRVGIQTLNS